MGMENFNIPSEKLWKIGAVLGEKYFEQCKVQDGIAEEQITKVHIAKWFKNAKCNFYVGSSANLYSCPAGLFASRDLVVISVYDALILFGIDKLEESVERCVACVHEYQQDYENFLKEKEVKE